MHENIVFSHFSGRNVLHIYYTLNSLTLFWLAKSVQWIFFQKSARNVITGDYTIIMSRTLKVTGNHVMYDRSAWFLRVIMSSLRALCCLPSVKKQKYDFNFFCSMYNKTIFRFDFCDIQTNNQGLGKDYQPRPLALADNPYLWISQKPNLIIVYNKMYTFCLRPHDLRMIDRDKMSRPRNLATKLAYQTKWVSIICCYACCTIHPYISYYFENKQITDEPDKTEDEAAIQEEEGNQSK